MLLQHNVDLKPYNTFGISVQADLQCAWCATIVESTRTVGETALILGGGSNILFTQDLHGLVMLNEIPVDTLSDHLIL